MRDVEAATITAGVGLRGDRHARRGSPRQVLASDTEVLEALGVSPGDIRENLTLRGVGVQALPPGTRLRIGAVEFTVAAPCQPCRRMEEVRGGLQGVLEGQRGRFLIPEVDGDLRRGDSVTVTPGRP